jgi:hypothetical protein
LFPPRQEKVKKYHFLLKWGKWGQLMLLHCMSFSTPLLESFAFTPSSPTIEGEAQNKDGPDFFDHAAIEHPAPGHISRLFPPGAMTGA